jgi:hypothetical protein
MNIINGVPEKKYRQMQVLQDAVSEELPDHWYNTIYQERDSRSIIVATDYEGVYSYIKKKYPNAEQRAWRDNNHKYAIYIKVSPKIMKRAILICLKAETRRHKAEIKRLRKL